MKPIFYAIISIILFLQSFAWSDSNSVVDHEIRNKAAVEMTIGAVALAVSVPLLYLSAKTYLEHDKGYGKQIVGGIGFAISIPICISGCGLMISSLHLFSRRKIPAEITE